MKKIPLLLLFALTSCGIAYDGETRLITETTVLDRNGNLLQDIEVKITAQNGSYTDVVSSGFSNATGNTQLIFPKPENSSMEISFSNPALGYETKMFYDVTPDDFDNYKLVMDQVVVLKADDIVNLEVQFVNTFADNKTFVSANLVGLVAAPQLLNQTQQQFNGETQAFRVAKNQTVIINYTLFDNATQLSSDYSLPVLIENDPVVQPINY